MGRYRAGGMGLHQSVRRLSVRCVGVVELETPGGDLHHGLEPKKSESIFEVDVRRDDGISRGQGRLVYQRCIYASKPNGGEGLLSTRDQAAMGQGGISAFDQAAMGQGGTLLQMCIKCVLNMRATRIGVGDQICFGIPL